MADIPYQDSEVVLVFNRWLTCLDFHLLCIYSPSHLLVCLPDLVVKGWLELLNEPNCREYPLHCFPDGRNVPFADLSNESFDLINRCLHIILGGFLITNGHSELFNLPVFVVLELNESTLEGFYAHSRLVLDLIFSPLEFVNESIFDYIITCSYFLEMSLKLISSLPQVSRKLIKLILSPELVCWFKSGLFKEIKYIDSSFLIVRYGVTIHGLKLIGLDIIAKSLVSLFNFFCHPRDLLDPLFDLLGIEIDLLLLLKVVAKVLKLIHLLIEVDLLVCDDEIKLDLQFRVLAELLSQHLY